LHDSQKHRQTSSSVPGIHNHCQISTSIIRHPQSLPDTHKHCQTYKLFHINQEMLTEMSQKIIPFESNQNGFSLVCKRANMSVKRVTVGDATRTNEDWFKLSHPVDKGANTESEWILKSSLKLSNNSIMGTVKIKCGDAIRRASNQICKDCTDDKCAVRFVWDAGSSRISSQCGLYVE
jgi:hypothetical protein